MYEQALLREQFQQLMDETRTAEQAYADLAGQAADPEMRQKLQYLHREKQRHVQLTQRLLEILG